MVKEKSLLIAFLVIMILVSTTSVSAIVFSDSVTTYFTLTEKCLEGQCNVKCYVDSECGKDYYDNEEYYCKGKAVYWKRTFHDQGCKNGACYNITSFQEQLVEICAYGCENGKCTEPEEPECCEDLDCGSATSELICVGNNVTKKIINPICVKGKCEVKINYEFVKKCEYGCWNRYCLDQCYKDLDCQEDYYSDKYCQDNAVYHDFYDFSCQKGKCVENIIKKLIEKCSDLCLDGACVNIFCKKNSDCGTDGFVGEKYCQGKEVYQDYKSFTCKELNTINSSCSSSTIPKFIEECDYKCENGKCIEKEEEPECCEDLDCGSAISELVCIGKDVYNKTVIPVCIEGKCENKTDYELVEECEKGCEDGKCIKEKKAFSGGRKLEIDYCGDGFCDKEIGEDEISCYEDCKVSVAKISTSTQTTTAEETEANKIQLGNKFVISAKDKSIGSLIFISLLILTVILFIILVLVLLFKR